MTDSRRNGSSGLRESCRSRGDRGSGPVEYIAIILLIAIIVAAFVGSALPFLIGGDIQAAICKVSAPAGASCTRDGGGSGPQEKPGAGTPAGSRAGTTSSTPPTSTTPAGSSPRNTGWNAPYAGMSAPEAAWSALGDQVTGFLGGLGHFFSESAKGIGGGIWSDLVGMKDLVVHPIDSFKGLWWAATHPTESLPKLVWDDQSSKDWHNGHKVKAGARTVWNIGSWFIPYYDIAKGVGKAGKFGKLGKAEKLAKLGKLADAADRAAKAAERAKQAARVGDAAGAEKAAKEAREAADEAATEARKHGCKVVGLGPPERPTERLTHFGRMATALHIAFREEGCGPDADGNGTDDNVDAARRNADEAERAQHAAERVQRAKDIEDALNARRYEDADRLVDDAEKEAQRAQAAANRNPTPGSRQEASDARKAADTARNKVLDEKIKNALKSADPEQRVPGEVAQRLRAYLRSFEKKYGQNGRDGEIDIETNNAIVEVATGVRAKGKVRQAMANKNNPITNPANKPIIIYAPNMKYGAARNLERETGSKVVQNMDDLERELRAAGEPIPR